MGNTSSSFGGGRYADTIEQIRLAVDGEWESVSMMLREHAGERLGDAATPGTAAWHLRHTAEIFRLHARHLIGDEVEGWPVMPEGTGEDAVTVAVGVLREDVGRLVRWAEGGGLAGGANGGSGGGPDGGTGEREVAVAYGGVRSVSEMLGVMLRHVVWHAAAAHYWCRWVRDARTSTGGGSLP